MKIVDSLRAKIDMKLTDKAKTEAVIPRFGKINNRIRLILGIE